MRPAVVNPLPRTPDEIVAWFQALTPTDWQLALVGAATASSVALLLVLGLMVVLAIGRRRREP